MTTQNTIEIAAADNVLTVPTLAIKQENGKKTVRVLGTDGKPQTREVQTGLKDSMNTEIKSGLQEGEQVVMNELSAAEEKAKVEKDMQRGGPPR